MICCFLFLFACKVIPHALKILKIDMAQPGTKLKRPTTTTFTNKHMYLTPKYEQLNLKQSSPKYESINFRQRTPKSEKKSGKTPKSEKARLKPNNSKLDKHNVKEGKNSLASKRSDPSQSLARETSLTREKIAGFQLNSKKCHDEAQIKIPPGKQLSNNKLTGLICYLITRSPCGCVSMDSATCGAILQVYHGLPGVCEVI